MKYDSYKTPRGETIVKAKLNGSYTLDELLGELEANTSFKRADGLGVVSFIAEYMRRRLSEGATVTLDGIGTFGVSLQVARPADESNLTGNHVELKRITFRAAPQFKSDIAAGTSYNRIFKDLRNNQTPRYTREQRTEKLQELLAARPEFSSRDYEAVTGLSRSAASEDLRRYTGQGLLASHSVGSAKLYYKPRV